MPEIPRFQGPEVDPEVRSADVSALTAPERAISDLAETVTRAGFFAADVIGKHRQELKQAEDIAFQATLDREKSVLIDDLRQKAEPLIRDGKFTELREMLEGPTVDDLASRRVEALPEERRDAAMSELRAAGFRAFPQFTAAARDMASAIDRERVQNSLATGIESVNAARGKQIETEYKAQLIGTTERIMQSVDAGTIGEAQALDMLRANEADLSSAAVDAVMAESIQIFTDTRSARAAESYLLAQRAKIREFVDKDVLNDAEIKIDRQINAYRQEEGSQVAKYQSTLLSQADKDIAQSVKSGSVLGVERAQGIYRRLAEDAANEEIRARANGALARSMQADVVGAATERQNDIISSQRAIADDAPVTFSSPERASDLLSEAMDRDFQQAALTGNTVAESPLYRVGVANRAILNNGNGVIPKRAADVYRELADQAMADPSHMQVLANSVRSMQEVSSTQYAAFARTAVGRQATTMARVYERSYERTLAQLKAAELQRVGAGGQTRRYGTGPQPEVPTDRMAAIQAQAAATAFQAAQAAGSTSQRGLKQFSDVQDVTAKIAESPEFATAYAGLKDDSFFRDGTFKAGVMASAGMTSDQYDAFVGAERDAGLNQIIHNELFTKTKEFYTYNTAGKFDSLSDDVEEAFRLAAGSVFDRYKMGPYGMQDAGPLSGTPTIAVRESVMQDIAAKAAAAGFPSDMLDRLVKQDGYKIIGDDRNGYGIYENGVYPFTLPDGRPFIYRKGQK